MFHLSSRNLRRGMAGPVPFITCGCFGVAIAGFFIIPHDCWIGSAASLAVAYKSSCDVATSVGSLHSMRTDERSFQDAHEMTKRQVASDSQSDSCLLFIEVGDDP